MSHLRCEQFTDGGPSPAAYYADRLKEAFREVCLLYHGRRRVLLSALEPLWNFVETMATARLFGVRRALYDQVDQQIERMNRGMLIKLALQCFLSPSVERYLTALRSGAVHPRDAVMLYLRLRATLDWVSDNTVIVDHPVQGLDRLLERFQRVVNDNHEALRALSQAHPEIRSFWRVIIARADRDFLTQDYTKLIE